MKILIVSQYFYPESFRINSLCQELVNRGHEVTVLTGYPNYPQGKFYEGYGVKKPYQRVWNGINIERVKIIPRGKTPIGLLLNCISFVISGRQWARKCKKQFDVCHVFEVSPVTVALPAIMYKRKHKTPIFFNVQDLWPENVEVVLGVKNKTILKILNRLVDSIYRNCDKILCASQSFVENIVKRGVPSDKVFYWPQYCDEFNTDNCQRPILFKEDCFNIVFAGNIGGAQGLDIMLDAAEILGDSYHVKWYLIGDGRDKERLMQESEKRGLSDSIIYIDKMSETEVIPYIVHSDCAFLSLMKNKIFQMTIPAKLQTYMMCKVPIIGACEGEVARIITEAKCGEVVEPGNGKSLADGVRKLLQRSKEELRELGENSFSYYSNNFKKEKLVNELESFFRNEHGK